MYGYVTSCHKVITHKVNTITYNSKTTKGNEHKYIIVYSLIENEAVEATI